jgi:hypothetical protein
MKLLGHVMYGHENGGSYFDGAPDGVLCPNCRACLNFDYFPNDLEIETYYDISATQDNRLIFSERAKNFLVERFDVRVFTVGAWKNSALFHVVPRHIVPFNATGRGTRFVDHCNVCGSYKSIVGATPAHLALENMERQCFWRTDIVFGSYEEKASLVVVGLDTARDMQDRGFSGCVFFDAWSDV